MTTTDTSAQVQPIDAVAERLNDPAVAASLVTLLDNAELLSTLVLGLSGLIARSEMIMDSVVEGLNDFRTGSGDALAGVPTLDDVRTATSELVEAAPTVREILASSMVRPETIQLLSTFSEAALDGAAAAQRDQTGLGVIGAVKALRDPEVQRGLGLFIEISRALGRRVDALGTGNG